MRSSTPPWPGISVDESFTPALRLRATRRDPRRCRARRPRPTCRTSSQMLTPLKTQSPPSVIAAVPKTNPPMRALDGLLRADRRRQLAPAERAAGVVLRRVADDDRRHQQQRRVAPADGPDGGQRAERQADVEHGKSDAAASRRTAGPGCPRAIASDADARERGETDERRAAARRRRRPRTPPRRRRRSESIGTLRAERGGEVGVLGEGDRRREHREEQRRVRRQKADDAEDERREHDGAQNACHQRPATTGLLMPP